jgi:hypothetical protein
VSSSPSDVNNVTTIKLWFLAADPGGGQVIQDATIKKYPDETIYIK